MKGRCQQATKLIAQKYWGSINLNNGEIARKCMLSIRTVQQMTRKYKKEQHA